MCASCFREVGGLSLNSRWSRLEGHFCRQQLHAMPYGSYNCDTIINSYHSMMLRIKLMPNRCTWHGISASAVRTSTAGSIGATARIWHCWHFTSCFTGAHIMHSMQIVTKVDSMLCGFILHSNIFGRETRLTCSRSSVSSHFLPPHMRD